MAPPKKFTDEQLKHYLDLDFSYHEIARFLNVSVEAVSLRARKFDKVKAAQAPAVVDEALTSVFDTKRVLEENYRACIALLEDPDNDPIRVRTLVLSHIREGMDVLKTLYTLQEQQAFQDEVLTVLDEFDPGTRQKVLDKLRQRRALRSAFLPN